MSDDELAIAPPYTALLLFEDGAEIHGYGIGHEGISCGELCFNTAMTGYEEILTDPSYFGQIITFTTPHIGNVGCNKDDIESTFTSAKGLVIREPITHPSSWRSTMHFDAWLSDMNLTGISGVDTRALTVLMRQKGHPKAALAYSKDGVDAIDRIEVVNALKETKSMSGSELTEHARSEQTRRWSQSIWESIAGAYVEKPDGKWHVVAIDYGAKLNILRLLTANDCRVTVVPGNTSLDDILKLAPDGVFLSNGPGDPSATSQFAIPVIQGLLARNIPVFGICLGHQLLALAMGARTEKMYQGHRGANHPVKSVDTGKVEITSQNHGFVVCSDQLPPDIEVTHLSLFDGTIEGIRHKSKPAFSVQYHPESSPGPHDSEYLFAEFVTMIEEYKQDAET